VRGLCCSVLPISEMDSPACPSGKMKSINYWQGDTDEKTEILGGKHLANMYGKGRAVSVERGGTYSKHRLYSKSSLFRLYKR